MPSAFHLIGATEDVRGSCDELEHAGDAACAGDVTPRAEDDSTSSTVEDAISTTPSTGGHGLAEVRTVSAGVAGSIVVAVDATNLGLMSTSPNPGWTVDIVQAAGREIEVTFRSGSLRVDVQVEIDDGVVRERVRTRDDVTNAETPTEDGVVVDDSSGPGSGSDDSMDDSSGPGSGDDLSDDSSGHGGDDGPDHD